MSVLANADVQIAVETIEVHRHICTCILYIESRCLETENAGHTNVGLPNVGRKLSHVLLDQPRI